MPQISVIIPVYNTEKYVEKCLNSIKEQTMKDIEIVIINDGSTDNSDKIIEKWIKNNQEEISIKYIKQENKGLAEARNNGVKVATGKYISFVDSDDYIEKDLYKNLEKYINKNVDLIKFKMTTLDENNQIIEKLDGPIFDICSGEEAFEKLCTTDIFLEVACIYLYKREIFVQNNFKYSTGTYHEDFGLTPYLIIKAKEVVSTNEYGYYYLQRENSITSIENDKKEIEKANDVLKHYDIAMERIEKEKVSEKTKMLFKRYYSNSLILKAKSLKGQALEEFIAEIKKRKVYKNIKAENLKQLIKKIILKINIEIYLKMR